MPFMLRGDLCKIRLMSMLPVAAASESSILLLLSSSPDRFSGWFRGFMVNIILSRHISPSFSWSFFDQYDVDSQHNSIIQCNVNADGGGAVVVLHPHYDQLLHRQPRRLSNRRKDGVSNRWEGKGEGKRINLNYLFLFIFIIFFYFNHLRRRPVETLESSIGKQA